MVDFISQLLADMTAQQKPEPIAFVNGQPVINPKYQGPAVQKAQLTQTPALQSRIDDMLGLLQYQDPMMQRMRLPLERKVNTLLGESVWPPLR